MYRDEMGLMELISGASVTKIVHSQIEKHIADQCKGNFDTAYLSILEEVSRFDLCCQQCLYIHTPFFIS